MEIIKMKIIIFGATGGIGKWAVKIALVKGFDVVAYARNPSKIDFKDEKLTIVKGEITNFEDIRNAMKGCDAVINCLGLSMAPFQKEFPALVANEYIIKAMKELGIKRYITWATPSVKAEGDKKSYITVLPPFLAGIIFPKGKKVLVALAKEVENSGLDWTIVRFMAPKNTSHTGKMKVSFGKEKLSFNIARADIADFMVQQISSDKYIHKMPIIGS